MIFTLRVELIGGRYYSGECVRVIEIPEEMTLLDLYHVIMKSVRFENGDHLFEFYAGRGPRHRAIVFGEDEFGEDELGEAASAGSGGGTYAEIPLNKVYPLARYKLYFLYDFGDSWLFEIKKLRQAKPPQPRVKYPRVIEKIGRNPSQYPKYDY
jgi:hypothetical protein